MLQKCWHNIFQANHLNVDKYLAATMLKCFIEIVRKKSKQYCINIYLIYCENDNLDVIRIVMVKIIRPNFLILMNIF